MTKQDQIKELAAVIRKDYPEVNAEHIATLAVEWFNAILLYKTTIDIIKSTEKISQMATDLVYKHFSNYNVNCPVCGASNCKNNETCINCKCQL
jgi:hypothetical protein